MTIKILQWNILCDEDPKKVADLIKQINPDIACLQELTSGYQGTSDVAAYIARETGLSATHHCGPMQMPDGTSSQMGNGIFSKYPITSERWAQLQPGVVHEDRVIQDERSYVEALIDIGGTTVYIGTTHLGFRPSMRTTKAKRLSVDHLLAEIKRVKRPYILTGDFNATPTSWTIKTMSTQMQLAGPGLAQKTWTTKPWTIGGLRFDKLNWRLDYVFTTPDVKVTSAKIIPTEFSDHLPILCEIEI